MGERTSAGPASSHQPLMRLASHVRGEWEDFNTSMRQPVNSVARLQLETIALIRGLHCNLPSTSRIPTTPSSSSDSRLDRPASTKGREDVSSKLMALASHMSGMREQVSQMLTNSQILAQAAISIEDELDVFGTQLERLRESSSKTQTQRTPPPMSPRTCTSESEGTDADDDVDDGSSDGHQEATTPGLEDPLDTTRVDYFGNWASPGTCGGQKAMRIATKRPREDSDSEEVDAAISSRQHGIAPPPGLLRAQSAAAAIGAQHYPRRMATDTRPMKRRRCLVEQTLRRTMSQSGC